MITMIPFTAVIKNLKYRIIATPEQFDPNKFQGTLTWFFIQAGFKCEYLTRYEQQFNIYLIFFNSEEIAKRFCFQYKTEYEELNLNKIYRDDCPFIFSSFNHYIWAIDKDDILVPIKNERLKWMMNVIGKLGTDFDITRRVTNKQSYNIFGFREQKKAFMFKMAYERSSSYIEIMDRF